MVISNKITKGQIYKKLKSSEEFKFFKLKYYLPFNF